MNSHQKPAQKPVNPNFSSGPCSKRSGYSLANLSTETLGRSHRSRIGKAALKNAIDESKRLLGLPDGYLLGLFLASDTVVMEMAVWFMLCERALDVCHCESFGQGWLTDIVKQLNLSDVNEITADYGQLPDLSKTYSANDIVFTWNGTTSGVKVDRADWIADDRHGLTICDATSAVFAMDIPWNKIDVATYSWQKVLGGEGAHGVLILSPRAVKRLESFIPDRPLPKIFRMTKGGKLIADIFTGATINTPSMLAVEDYNDALSWVDSCGGLSAMIERSNNNLAVLEKFVSENEWINFLAEEKAIRSNTSVCLKLDLSGDQIKAMTKLLESEEVAYDVGAYRDAPDGLRIWCGATVESSDLEALLPWLAWAYEEVKNK